MAGIEPSSFAFQAPWIHQAALLALKTFAASEARFWPATENKHFSILAQLVSNDTRFKSSINQDLSEIALLLALPFAFAFARGGLLGKLLHFEN